jgi:hypothetical protein
MSPPLYKQYKNSFMTIFQYLLFIIIALLIASIISSLFLKKKDLPVELFVEGLRYENDGHFDEAIINYENALSEVKKNRFHRDLENRIIQKLKVLHTISEYKKNIQFTR